MDMTGFCDGGCGGGYDGEKMVVRNMARAVGPGSGGHEANGTGFAHDSVLEEGLGEILADGMDIGDPALSVVCGPCQD